MPGTQVKLAKKADLLTVATAADTAQSTADGAQSTADAAGTVAVSAAAAAAAAQTTANTGVTNAAAAQTTANTANTAAGAAQTTANTANTAAGTAQTTATTGVTNAATAQSTADAAVAAATLAAQLANQALNIAKPISQGTFLVSGGAVAFAGTRSFVVSPAVYVINGTQYTSPQSTVTLGAADATNPRFDTIVVDTLGAVSVVAGTAGATPAFPDVDPALYLALRSIRIDAAASSVAIAVTDLYRNSPAAWPATTSGASINAASTTNPQNGANDIEATAAAANDYVRLTAAAAVSLAAQRQLVLSIRPKAAFPNAKSIAATFYLAGVKVGQSVTIKDGQFGFASGTLSYQQLVIPIASFVVPTSTLVDRLELKVIGGGGSIGFYVDDVFLEGASTAVPEPIVTQLQAQVDALRIRTMTFTVDGGAGLVITTGPKGHLPVDFAGKILGWEILGDGASGSIVFDVWKDTLANFPPTVADTITAAAKPTVTATLQASSATLTGWNTSFNAGDVFRINVDSVTNFTFAVLALKVQVAG